MRKVYDLTDFTQRPAIRRALSRKPKTMWFRTEKGSVKAINPRPRYDHGVWVGIDCDLEVEPQCCAVIRND